MKRKRKQLEQEKLDRDFGYDGYYNDVEPEDVNEQPKEKNENPSMVIKVSALIFGAILIISVVVIFMVAF